jgi:hypothetical protein
VYRKFKLLFSALVLLSLLIVPVGGASALTNLVQDPSFEVAISSTAVWQQASTNSDSPLCTLAIPECNFGSGTAAARTGSVWAMFGGIDFTDPEAGSPEIAYVKQNVAFPTCSAELQFYFWIGAAPAGSDASDVFLARIDGTTVFSANATQKASYPSYTLVTVDVAAFANGTFHNLEFYSVTAGQTVIFNLDDISLVRNCFAISGNAGVAGATLNYTGGSTTADGSGNYSFDVKSGWSGTVTPSKSGYRFSPVNKTYSNVFADQTAQNYTAIILYSISGNVGAAGATLSYTDGTPQTATSAPNGDYSFMVPSNWNGTVTPSHTCFNFTPSNRSYTNVTTNQTSQNYTTAPKPGSGCANIDVQIAGANQASFGIPSASTVLQAPLNGINNGPVKITSTVPIMGSERVIYNVNGMPTSFSEMMALPDSQLDNMYWMPWYNNVDLNTQLRFGNVSGSPATVHVWIGGQEKTSGCTTTPANIPYPYVLAVGASLRVSCPGVNNGPVKIDSNVNIVAAERVIYNVNGLPTSFTEMMGLPDSQLDNIYWMPWYNNVDLDTQLRFGNVSNTDATVHVWIGGQEKSSGCLPSNIPYPYVLAPGASLRVSCPSVNNGPVQIVSDVNIVAAERVIYNVNGMPTSFSEMMALPTSQLNTTYWMPKYNNVDLDTQLRFGNVSGAQATVRVYIGGQEQTSGCTPSNSPYTLADGASLRISCAGVNNGPVQIVSTGNIVASERVIYNVNGAPTSFSEMIGLPNGLLNTIHWLPWYNNVDLDTQLRFGVP